MFTPLLTVTAEHSFRFRKLFILLVAFKVYGLLRNKKHVRTRSPVSVRQSDRRISAEQLDNLVYAGHGREPDNKQTKDSHHWVIDSNKSQTR